ncbi:MAG: hypothetical protein JJT96_04620 [Opitutales bacterium]|nr:hypothetical protein [Opitutales bacterium]
MTPENGGNRVVGGLRTTWMTMALNGGVSLEDVKKICGNVDAETILKLLDQMSGNNWRMVSQQLFERIQGLRKVS